MSDGSYVMDENLEDIKIIINQPCVPSTIQGIQELEKSLDETLLRFGLTRTTSTKGDMVILNYKRFAFKSTL